MSLALNHVAAGCSDDRATIHFYSDVLGLPLIRGVLGPVELLVFTIPGGGQLVFTVGAAATKTPRAAWQQRHIGLVVSSAADLSHLRARLRDHGIDHDLVDDDRLYFADPDGNVLELEIADPAF